VTVQQAKAALSVRVTSAEYVEPTFRVSTILKYVVLVLALFIALFPLYWLLNTSFKHRPEIFLSTPTFFPSQLTIENYVNLFASRNVVQFMINSLVVVSLSVIASMIIGSLAAYSLARFRLPWGLNQKVGFWILSTRMIPAIVIIVPIYLMIRDFGLINTYAGLALVYTAFNLPFVIWMMQSFFAEIPVDLEEAAMVDGDSRLTAFWRIVLPLSAPGLVATSIFAVITTYNEFLFALILSQTADSMTMPVGTSTLAGRIQSSWGEMTAIAAIAILPIMIFALAVQRHLVRGLTMGAVK
jgi:multiple sugar transport system permease protein